MKDYYQIIEGFLLLAFGIMLLIFRKALSEILHRSQKESNELLKSGPRDEKVDRAYAEKICIIVGSGFLLIGVYTFFR